MPKELNLSWVIRYGYGGALLYLILLIRDPASMKAYTESAGAVLAPLLLVGAGTCIYVVYRHLLGEWLLYPFAHRLDYYTARGNRDLTAGAVSPIWWLAQRGVAKGARREAYTAVRREFLPADTRKQLDLAHSEVHVLYLTFIELFGLGAILLADGNRWHLALVVAVSGLVFLLAAWAADVRLHRHEFRSIVSTDQSKRDGLEAFLASRGYVARSNKPLQPASGVDAAS